MGVVVVVVVVGVVVVRAGSVSVPDVYPAALAVKVAAVAGNAMIVFTEPVAVVDTVLETPRAAEGYCHRGGYQGTRGCLWPSPESLAVHSFGYRRTQARGVPIVVVVVVVAPVTVTLTVWLSVPAKTVRVYVPAVLGNVRVLVRLPVPLAGDAVPPPVRNESKR